MRRTQCDWGMRKKTRPAFKFLRVSWTGHTVALGSRRGLGKLQQYKSALKSPYTALISQPYNSNIKRPERWLLLQRTWVWAGHNRYSSCRNPMPSPEGHGHLCSHTNTRTHTGTQAHNNAYVHACVRIHTHMYTVSFFTLKINFKKITTQKSKNLQANRTKSKIQDTNQMSFTQGQTTNINSLLWQNT